MGCDGDQAVDVVAAAAVLDALGRQGVQPLLHPPCHLRLAKDTEARGDLLLRTQPPQEAEGSRSVVADGHVHDSRPVPEPIQRLRAKLGVRVELLCQRRGDGGETPVGGSSVVFLVVCKGHHDGKLRSKVDSLLLQLFQLLFNCVVVLQSGPVCLLLQLELPHPRELVKCPEQRNRLRRATKCSACGDDDRHGDERASLDTVPRLHVDHERLEGGEDGLEVLLGQQLFGHRGALGDEDGVVERVAFEKLVEGSRRPLRETGEGAQIVGRRWMRRWGEGDVEWRRWSDAGSSPRLFHTR